MRYNRTMLPYLFLSPSLRLSVWGLFVSLAALAVLLLGRRDARALGLAAGSVERLWPWLLFGGFAGAHLYYLAAVAGWPRRALPPLDVANIFAGTAVQGGLLGGALAAALYLRRTKAPALPLFDALSPAGAAAQALARVGCFAAGCCWGRRTSLFLGTIITSPYADPSAPRGVPLHPAQLYEAALDAVLAVVLRRRLKTRAAPGTIFASYLMGAALIRFAVQFFRGDDDGRLTLGLAHSQFTALAMFAAAAALGASLRRSRRNTVAPAPSPPDGAGATLGA
jgi:phosphatidylglycerol:prolipoprotein diacylglycerol transferase